VILGQKKRMRRIFLGFVFGLIGAFVAQATSIEPKSLKELVRDADHVVLGKVVKVEMIDKDGKEITDLRARTGPGLKTQIRLHVEAGKDGWLRTAKTNPPANVIIPLWQMWHYSLGHIKEAAEGEIGIFLLSGDNYLPVYPTGFHRPISEKSKILALLKVKNNENTQPSARVLNPRAKAAL
jgi:hypothetical protein